MRQRACGPRLVCGRRGARPSIGCTTAIDDLPGNPLDAIRYLEPWVWGNRSPSLHGPQDNGVFINLSWFLALNATLSKISHCSSKPGRIWKTTAIRQQANRLEEIDIGYLLHPISLARVYCDIPRTTKHQKIRPGVGKLFDVTKAFGEDSVISFEQVFMLSHRALCGDLVRLGKSQASKKSQR